MQLESFVEDFNGASYELYEFAEAAVDVEDCLELKEAALAYLKAKEELICTMLELGVEIG